MEVKDKLLLTPEDFKPSFRNWKIEGVLNPSAVRLKNKKIMLYVRVAESHKEQDGHVRFPMIVSKNKYKTIAEKFPKRDVLIRGEIILLNEGICRLPNISHFRRVILDKSGFNVERIGKSPHFIGKPGESEYGVEDCRITKIGKKYYMTYVGVSKKQGISTYLAESDNLLNWRRKGIIFREQNKDAALFPEKIDNEYVAVHRPESLFAFRRPSVWLSFSKDLVYWGKDRDILEPRKNSWEELRVGAGPQPIKTSKGWLMIYHGVMEKRKLKHYSAGAALLNLKKPWKVIARSSKKEPLLVPNKDYEKTGYMNNVVFPSGAVETLDKEALLLYCGGADSVTSVKEVNYSDIYKNLRLRNKR